MIMPSTLYHIVENLIMMPTQQTASLFVLGCYHTMVSHATISSVPPHQERESTNHDITKDYRKIMPSIP